MLTHRHHLIARFISLAQKRRFRGSLAPYAHWSHAALVVDEKGDLVEAESLGVTRSPVSKYLMNEYHLVRLGSDFVDADRHRAVEVAEAQVGKGFGYLALLSVSLYLLFGLPTRWARHGHETCSGLVVSSLHAGGRLLDLDPLRTLPADLAKRYNVRP